MKGDFVSVFFEWKCHRTVEWHLEEICGEVKSL